MPVVRVAVIGSGLAGLTAAHLLQKATARGPTGEDVRFEVHLYEKSQRLGLSSASVVFKDAQGRQRLIDTPMRSIQGGYYKRTFALYRYLGVELIRHNYTYSFSSLSRSASNIAWRTRFIYSGSNGLSLRPVGIPRACNTITSLARYLALVISVALCYILLACFSIYHLLRGHLSDPRHPISHQSLEDWQRSSYVSTHFVNLIVLPMFACVCTCTRDQLLHHPIAEILEYIALTFGASHYLVKNGVKQVAIRLCAPLTPDQIHLNADVINLISTEDDQVVLTLADGSSHTFDHLILATQANQAASLLSLLAKSLDASGASAESLHAEHERVDALRLFKYTPTVVINHQDASVMPCDHDQRDLNIALSEHLLDSHLSRSDDKGTLGCMSFEHVMATHALDPSLTGDDAVYQTTNPILPISRVISTAPFERVVLTKQSKAVLSCFVPGREASRHFQGQRHVWFCGSWAAEGIPLLEGCVVSAERTVLAILQSQDPSICPSKAHLF
ncbi:uncharacterized protein L969DRAFT_93868 [Mixia osmundae IAM 14324]|uniref:Amine oxidase domain-containing protein n=1 Tax=Mixia osmundae (strain CBS 9802 / IAM 14324 / JCM 22182 / KY 12970) TaxID=764103 RepID=G7E9T7_MIXOS|nr:uncharacterized protein L969DRAFT_93868 [Mixia osmundae IAM 14324]KEI40039.1 hypothetical protein L969DRAFT_93868 [Mixia osmundae IAM 14324]GAA99406.1 hypothetical protein E5Q_06104 [Mixia osmundae IAM 14324]